MAQLKTTVFVRDPATNQTVELAPGTLPEPRLAALVTNPAAWVDGKLPRLKTQTKTETGKDPEGADGPSGDGPDAASGGGSGPDSANGDLQGPADEAGQAPAKAAPRKTTARKPAAQ
ncbi:hypothetical protein [Streptomyces sp. NPDC096351]|uniref:hypothetical protein n=1 Tax=Streptomyces sp. NPDC096351 TaxID=3366087 RepID=UPI003804E5AC